MKHGPGWMYVDLQVGQKVWVADGVPGVIYAIRKDTFGMKYHVMTGPGQGGLFGPGEVTPILKAGQVFDPKAKLWLQREETYSDFPTWTHLKRDALVMLEDDFQELQTKHPYMYRKCLFVEIKE